MVSIESADDWRSKAVTEQRRAIHFRVAHHGIDRASEEVNRVGDLRLVAFAVAGKIQKNQARLFVQRWHLKAPGVQIASPAVNEHERLRAVAEAYVMNAIGAEFGEMGWGLIELVGC